MRLLPLLTALVIISFIDRSSVAFASLQVRTRYITTQQATGAPPPHRMPRPPCDAATGTQMTRQLGLSASQHALGAGAFSLSYAVGQLPSAFALRRWGGPAWLGTTAAAWGCAAAACAASAGAVSFVLLRLLLGLAEPGGLPGVWAYMSTVYPPGRTALPFAVLEAGMTASSQVRLLL